MEGGGIGGRPGSPGIFESFPSRTARIIVLTRGKGAFKSRVLNVALKTAKELSLIEPNSKSNSVQFNHPFSSFAWNLRIGKRLLMWKLDSRDWHPLKNCTAKFTLIVGEGKQKYNHCRKLSNLNGRSGRGPSNDVTRLQMNWQVPSRDRRQKRSDGKV